MAGVHGVMRWLAFVGLVLLLLARVGGAAATTQTYEPQWSGWSPNADPVAYCKTAASTNGTAQYGWSDAGPVYAWTTTGQKATCYESCAGSQCGGSPYGVTGGSVVNNRTASCIASPGDTFNSSTGQCVGTVPPPAPAPNSSASAYCTSGAGTSAGQRVVQSATLSSPASVSFCVGGLGPLADGTSASCVASGSVDVAASKDGKNYQWINDGQYTGAVCDSTVPVSAPVPATTTASDPTKCSDPATCAPPEGQCPGTVNGVAVWVACSSSTKQTTTTTNKPPAADGSTSKDVTTTTTNCSAGKCTSSDSTTTTTTSSTGTVTTTVTAGGSATKSLTDYCKTNAKDPQCADQSGWGGSCSAGFECSGDAAICAAAKGVWEQKCALVDGPSTPTKEQTAYAAASAASGSGMAAPRAVAVGSADFDASNALGQGAQCVADMQVTVWGAAQTIELSKVCPWLTILGTLMLSLAWLSAAVIVGKGVTA